MSQANVESAGRLVDAFNRRDIDAITELTTADFEWFPAMPGTAVGGSFKGREGLERYLADLGDTWAEYRSVDLEFRDVGERVLALGRLEGDGRASGAWGDAEQGTIFEFRDGVICSVRTYLDHAEALKEIGLDA